MSTPREMGCLHFKCSDILGKDQRSSPNSQLLLKEAGQEGTWVSLGESEIVHGTSSPAYVSGLQIPFRETENRQLQVEIYEVTDDPQARWLLGTVKFSYAELIQSENQALSRDLTLGNEAAGNIQILFEYVDVVHESQVLSLQMEIKPCNSPGSEFSCKFYRPRRLKGQLEEGQLVNDVDPRTNNDLLLVYDTPFGEHHRSSHVYSWDPITFDPAHINAEQMETAVVLELEGRDLNPNVGPGDNKVLVKRLLVEETSLARLEQQTQEFTFMHNGTEYGVLQLRLHMHERPPPSTIPVALPLPSTSLHPENIKMQLLVCIDFTRTNGRTGLHTRKLEANPYALIMRDIGGALIDYDREAKVAMLGFGGLLPGLGKTHCFSLNGKIFEPEVPSLSKGLETYLNALDIITPSGPTYFAEVLTYVADVVSESKKTGNSPRPRYYVLLMIVDGSPADVNETTDALIRCSELPLSVIVVGIDRQLCQAAQEFLNSEKPLTSVEHETQASRDAVQYVEYDHKPESLPALAQTVTTKVHKQAEEFISASKLEPRRTIHSERQMQSPSHAIPTHAPDANSLAFSELQQKFKQDVYDDQLKTGEDKELSSQRTPYREPAFTESVRPLHGRPSNQFSTRRERAEQLLAEGFPTRNFHQFLEALNQPKFTNPLLIFHS